ncbi:MAG: class I tRNA ligase family protein [Patescibacteria group bacterium]|nr:class I tRNA ligase family protein [Patescibacteria group bacterium]
MNANPLTTRQGKNMNLTFTKIEKKILKFWKDNQIFEKSIEQRKKAQNFIFYEGPPYANALPGIHHLLARAFKDIICRYKTMRGFKVLRKAGWDTHGLPTEMEVEKKLGIKNKKEIEKLGIKRFIKECKKNVFIYKKEWEKFTERIGYWLDLKNPYITCDPDYIESVWWILKQIWQKGLLYKDYKVSPYCPRCQTVLSSHEVAQGYEKIKEPAIYIKFPILNPEFKNTSLLVWTTTPWTLPGNVAIAINPDFIYTKMKVNETTTPLPPSRAQDAGPSYLILAKERIEASGIKGEITKEFKGKDLIGLRYESLYPFSEEVIKQAYRVIPADFVSLEEGTGLVHIAPAFGEEDMEVGKKNNLPILLTVDEEGRFKLGIKKWARMFVKEADPKISEDLKNRNLLFKEELYEHDYPFCWRCHSPLLYYAKKSWFIRMTKVKKDLIRNNKKINWIPGHLKEGRFGEWLREIKDWTLSRERYWGTPLPIWQCKNCGNLEFIGSLKDLLNQNFSNNNYYLYRHGHSLRQEKKVVSCWPEKSLCPLTEKGEKQVLEIAKKLKNKKIDLIFSSNLLRAKQTAEILSKETDAKIIFDKRLREINVGIFNNQNPKLFWNYILTKKNPYLVKAPKGESLTDLQRRVYDFLKKIDKKYQGKNIIIVSHELPLTVLENTLKGWSIKEIIEWRKKNREKLIKTGQERKIEFKKLPFNKKMELDFHRPYIDEVRFYCPKCGSLMKRTLEVIDCWFDSGCMPFAQGHWPFAQTQNSKIKNQKYNLPELFPADYISEGVDQTRGWFYTLLAISTLLGFGSPYKNVISLGHVLDEKGEKMSKSKGNVVDPQDIVGKYGADATRWYFYTVNQPGDAKLFCEREINECLKRFIMTLWNCYSFFETYKIKSEIQKPKTKNILDRWIISRLNQLIQQVTENLDKYEVTFAARVIENFVIEDLSLWYIRRSRRRFQKPENKKELKEASATLNCVILTLSKLTAPFIPFLSEQIYSRLRWHLKQSVHLEDWPKVSKKLIDEKLNQKMKKTRELVTLALAERARSRIKVRQPLSRLKIKDLRFKLEKELLDLIKEEVNIKEIVFDPKIKKEVELDTEITPELKEEGIIREVIRQIQEMRKIAGLKPKDKILVRYFGPDELNEILEKNKNFILKETNIKNLSFKENQKAEVFAAQKEVMVHQQNLWLAIKKI